MDAVFYALCKDVDSPISLGLWMRYKYGEHKQLAEYDIPVRDYRECDSRRFSGDYLVSSFLSKWKGLQTGTDTEAVALQKFRTSEDTCRETNIRLRRFRSGISSDAGVEQVLYLAQRKISRLLGPFAYSRIVTHSGWGPGATWDLPRRKAQVDHKMALLPFTVSRSCLPLAGLMVSSDLHWSEAVLGRQPEGAFSLTRDCFNLVESCRAETVPKNAKTDRFIAIEPTLNLFVQKGVGGFLRRRLKTVGVDLDDQRVNQGLAQRALLDDLATLDLRAASDTISKEIVFDLLPVEWANCLDDLRSKSVDLPDGTNVRLEKFSSMGNGFTFELESLIFWALVSSVTDLEAPGAPFSVYGDDLICHKQAVSRLRVVLTHCGFELNGDKSFSEGLFYESCGKHYFGDCEVTPCYQKKIVASTAELVRCHNRLYRWYGRARPGEPRSGCLAAARIDKRAYDRFRIPEGSESDDGFLVSDEVFVRTSIGFCPSRGWKTRILAAVTVALPAIEEALLAQYFRWNTSPLIRDSVKASDGRPGITFQLNNVETTEFKRGDIDIPVLGQDREVVFREKTKWIIPQGVCPVPLR